MIHASEHPSRFELEEYQARDLSGDESRKVTRHLESCCQCAAYVAELAREQLELLARLPPSMLARSLAERTATQWIHQRPGRWHDPAGWWLRRLAPVAAGILVLGLGVWAMRGSPEDRAPEHLRLMGGPEVTLYQKNHGPLDTEGGRVRLRREGAVRFGLVTPVDGFVCVFFMDGQGSVSWFVPELADGPPMRVPAGESLLPGSVTLEGDSATGGFFRERAVVIFRAEPFSPRQVADRIRQAYMSAAGSILEDDTWLSEEIGMWSVILEGP